MQFLVYPLKSYYSIVFVFSFLISPSCVPPHQMCVSVSVCVHAHACTHTSLLLLSSMLTWGSSCCETLCGPSFYQSCRYYTLLSHNPPFNSTQLLVHGPTWLSGILSILCLQSFPKFITGQLTWYPGLGNQKTIYILLYLIALSVYTNYCSC